jgi:hypothetical protein
MRNFWAAGSRQIQTVVIDQQGRLVLPQRPGVLGDILKYALAQLAAKRGPVQAGQLSP